MLEELRDGVVDIYKKEGMRVANKKECEEGLMRERLSWD